MTGEPLRVPVNRRGGLYLCSAFLVSTTGDWVYRFAVPILILQATGSAVSTAFAYALEFIPYIGLGLVAGVVADRWNRRRIMIFCDVTSLAITLVIAVLARSSHPPVAALYVAAFLLACVTPFYFPAFQGLLVDAVPEARLSRMNSWTQSIESTLSLAGPVLGTVLIAALGVRAATVLDAVSFGLSALLISRIAATRGARTAGANVLRTMARDFTSGMRGVWSTTSIRWGTLLMALANLAGCVVEGSLVFLALQVEDMSKIALGIVFSAQGLGALLGAVVAPRLIDRYAIGRLLTWSMGISAVSMMIPILYPRWWLVVVGWGAEGIATSLVVVSWFTARQMIVPSDLIGRVVSIGRAVAYATIPLGAVLGAWLIGVTSGDPVRVLFVVAAALQVAAFVGTWLSPVNHIDRVAGEGAAGEKSAQPAQA